MVLINLSTQLDILLSLIFIYEWRSVDRLYPLVSSSPVRLTSCIHIPFAREAVSRQIQRPLSSFSSSLSISPLSWLRLKRRRRTISIREKKITQKMGTRRLEIMGEYSNYVYVRTWRLLPWNNSGRELPRSSTSRKDMRWRKRRGEVTWFIIRGLQ